MKCGKTKKAELHALGYSVIKNRFRSVKLALFSVDWALLHEDGWEGGRIGLYGGRWSATCPRHKGSSQSIWGWLHQKEYLDDIRKKKSFCSCFVSNPDPMALLPVAHSIYRLICPSLLLQELKDLTLLPVFHMERYVYLSSQLTWSLTNDNNYKQFSRATWHNIRGKFAGLIPIR